MSGDALRIRSRKRLPHWEREGGSYFVTFRLADSLPASHIRQIVSERQSILRTAQQLDRPLSPDERRRLLQLSSKKVEVYLDRGSGACHLRDPVIAQSVADTLKLFDSERYELLAWCVMPNHVHVVLQLFPGVQLSTVVHSWKSFTAKQANRILGRSGTFWQREYYDRLMRDGNELDRTIAYVANNPIRAGLKDWPFVEVCRG